MGPDLDHLKLVDLLYKKVKWLLRPADQNEQPNAKGTDRLNPAFTGYEYEYTDTEGL